jgi:hypothetical protein
MLDMDPDAYLRPSRSTAWVALVLAAACGLAAVTLVVIDSLQAESSRRFHPALAAVLSLGGVLLLAIAYRLGRRLRAGGPVPRDPKARDYFGLAFMLGLVGATATLVNERWEHGIYLLIIAGASAWRGLELSRRPPQPPEGK